MSIVFGEIVFTRDEIFSQYSACNTIICMRVTNSYKKAALLSHKIWTEIVRELPRKDYFEDFTVWFFSKSRAIILDFLDDDPLTESQIRRLIPKDVPAYTNPSAILSDCDKCLGNVLLGLDHESRLMYLFKEICDLSYRMLTKVFEQDEHTIRKSIVKSRRKINNFLDTHCALYNDSSSITTGRSTQVRESNLADELRLVRSNSYKTNIFLECESLIKRQPFWQLEE